jgi:hypothetical protein
MLYVLMHKNCSSFNRNGMLVERQNEFLRIAKGFLFNTAVLDGFGLDVWLRLLAEDAERRRIKGIIFYFRVLPRVLRELLFLFKSKAMLKQETRV